MVCIDVVAVPGIGVVHRRAAETRPQLRDFTSVVIEAHALGRAQGVLDHRVRTDGKYEPALDFERVVDFVLRHQHLVGNGAFGLLGVRDGLAGNLRAKRTILGLAAGDENDVVLPGRDILTGSTEERRLKNTELRDLRACLRRADRVGDQPARVAVIPETSRRAHRIGAQQQLAGAGVLGRALERARHQNKRFARAARVFLTLEHRADADQNRSSRIQPAHATSPSKFSRMTMRISSLPSPSSSSTNSIGHKRPSGCG